MLMCLVLWLVPSVAGAQGETAEQQKNRARELYKHAQVQFRVGDLKQAADEFKKSYELYPAPETLYNLAQTYRLLKNYEQAIFQYKQFLHEGHPSESDRKLIDERIAEMEALLAAQRHTQEAPPVGTVPAVEKPTSAATGIAPVSISTENDRRQRQPIYKKWWLWTTVGVVAVGVGLGVGLGIGLEKNGTYHAPGVTF